MLTAAYFALAAAASPEAATSVPGATELFNAACRQGSVTLSKAYAAPVGFAKLPKGARQTLAQTVVEPSVPMPPPPPDAAEVPNPVYRIGAGDSLYLLAPAPGGVRGRFASSCAVIWKGEHYDEGRQAVFPEDHRVPGPSERPSSNPIGLSFHAWLVGEFYLSVTTLQGWTVLKAIPKADAPGAP